MDSGPAGTLDPGDRIMVFRAESRTFSCPATFGEHLGHSTASMETYAHVELAGFEPRPGETPYLDGFEASDLMAVYFALDHLNEVEEEGPVEIIGDGQALAMLGGRGVVSARWGGKNWVPELRAKIQQRESSLTGVSYRVIPSRDNPAGSYVKELKHRNRIRWRDRDPG